MSVYIAEAITAHWGERCPEFDGECNTCLAWKQYDETLIDKTDIARVILEHAGVMERLPPDFVKSIFDDIESLYEK